MKEDLKMIRLETVEKYRVNTEEEAKTTMEYFREEAKKNGYLIKKSGYEKKEKKAKGEIVDQGYLVSVTKVFDTFWG